MTATCTNISIPRTRQNRMAVVSWISLALKASHTRRALKALDADLLDDIGLSREEARQEATKPIWDVPSYWR
ncbi:MAG: DUF1127 domain-containing protein [Rhodobacteraceae bacterium]|nr:DUF1127 domain-containing protein [Paracoccaceae bacterium]